MYTSVIYHDLNNEKTCWLFAFSFIPESFRWYLSQNETKKANDVMFIIARVNGRTLPNLDHLESDVEKPSHIKYTVLQLFRTWQMAKTTILISSNW